MWKALYPPPPFPQLSGGCRVILPDNGDRQMVYAHACTECTQTRDGTNNSKRKTMMILYAYRTWIRHPLKKIIFYRLFWKMPKTSVPTFQFLNNIQNHRQLSEIQNKIYEKCFVLNVLLKKTHSYKKFCFIFRTLNKYCIQIFISWHYYFQTDSSKTNVLFFCSIFLMSIMAPKM